MNTTPTSSDYPSSTPVDYSTTSTHDENRTSADIEADIRTTRNRMDSTIDELGNRLNPRSLMNSAMDWWEKNSMAASGKSSFKAGYRSVAQQVKAHPVPSLLIGAGITWLLLNPEEDEDSRTYSNSFRRTQGGGTGRYGTEGYDPAYDYESEDAGDEQGIVSKIREKAHDARDKVSELVGEAKDKVQSMTHRAGEKMEGMGGMADEVKQKARNLMHQGGEMTHQARESMLHARESVKQKYDATMMQAKEAMDEYPLAVGAAFLALGALAGVLLPRTRREDEWLGQKADALKAEAKSKGEEILEEGKSVAKKIGEQVMDEAENKGLTAGAAGSKLSQLAHEAGEVVRKAAEEVGSAVKSEAAPSSETHVNSPSSQQGGSSQQPARQTHSV